MDNRLKIVKGAAKIAVSFEYTDPSLRDTAPLVLQAEVEMDKKLKEVFDKLFPQVQAKFSNIHLLESAFVYMGPMDRISPDDTPTDVGFHLILFFKSFHLNKLYCNANNSMTSTKVIPSTV